jgi:biopolymer transport protein ExbD
MRRKYTRRVRKPTELMLVPMIDIFTVLVTFLLMTAVFSRLAIVELDLPSAASAEPSEPMFRLEVIVREQGFELTNGSALIATIPKLQGEYDLNTLSQLALSLKRDHPDAQNASVLLEPEIAYDYLIQTMDAIRSTELPGAPSTELPAPGSTKLPAPGSTKLPAAADSQLTRVALFSDIAVGDAP